MSQHVVTARLYGALISLEATAIEVARLDDLVMDDSEVGILTAVLVDGLKVAHRPLH